MAKEPRPDGIYYIPRRRRQRVLRGGGRDGRRFCRRPTAAEDAYLDRVVAALDKATLTDLLARAAAEGDPKPVVYHAPESGRLFGFHFDDLEQLLAEPGARFVDVLYGALGLEWPRLVHFFFTPVRRLDVAAGRTRTSCFCMVVVDYDEADNN
jgi:hypothetical protein